MADKWAQYAEPAAPPRGADKWAQYAEPPAEKPGYWSQVGTGILNAAKGLAEVGSAAGGVATEPWNAAEHLRTLKKLILDPQVDQAIQAADKWKAGDRSEAVGHALASIIPGAGPAAANIGEKLGSGDVTGAAADATVLGGAMALPHVAGPIARTVAEPVAKAGTFTGAAIKGAAPGVAKGAAMVGGGELLAKVPGMEWPARIGMQYPGVRQVVSGVKTGYNAGKAALAERAAAKLVDTVPAEVSRVVGPQSPAPPPEPTGPPPPTIQQTLQDEMAAKRAPVAATAAPAENTTLLNDLAQQLNGTSFEKASPTSQATIRQIASRVNQPIPQELAAPPVQTRAPAPAPEPVTPSKSVQQVLQEEMAAKRASAVPPPAPARVPQAQSVAPVSVPPSTTAPQPVVEARPPQAQPVVAPGRMSLEEVEADMAKQPAPVLDPAGRSPYTATGELKSKALRVEEKIGAARAKNANEIAKELHDAGISSDQAKTMKFDDPRWKQIADELGHRKKPSQQTVEATLLELGRLERSHATR